LRQRSAQVLVVVKVVANNAGAKEGTSFLPLHASGLTGESFDAIRDVFFHRLGRHAAIERQHLHGGALEYRQDIDGHAPQTQSPQQRNGQRHDDNRMGIAQRKSNQALHVIVLSVEG
jgi:hypothetical protein